MGLIFCMTLNGKETFLSVTTPMRGINLSGLDELDHISTVCSLLVGENLPTYIHI